MPKEPWLRKRAAEAEARARSTALPRCPTCAHDEAKPALRTDLVQYFRCSRCGFVWSRPNPDADSTPKSA